MNKDLSKLFDRLRRSEKQAMTEFYKLTSAHVYGIIYRLVPFENKATTIMKKLYATFWDQRHDAIFRGDDIINVIRAKAHRAAIEYKLAHKIAGSGKNKDSDFKATDIKHLNHKLSIMDDTQLNVLNLAYLDAMSVDELALHFDREPADISQQLSKSVSQLTELHS